ncbi:MAG: hypothetical protein ONB44_17175 [candidate division KSB1 bacterium]|nr:hypothetical protein [candidate division KSB1 bacterium]MDZ7313208.1 hypothetical protein [candidate division KSB1 bacterium]
MIFLHEILGFFITQALPTPTSSKTGWHSRNATIVKIMMGWVSAFRLQRMVNPLSGFIEVVSVDGKGKP